MLDTSVVFVIFDSCPESPSILETPANVRMVNKTEDTHAADSLKLTDPRGTSSLLWLTFKTTL